MAKHIHIHLGPAKARDAKQHYNEGSMAATKGVKYDENPYEKGTQEHLDWSKGHNDLRAKRANDKKAKDAEGYNARLAKNLPRRIENLIAKIDSLAQLKAKLSAVLRDANELAPKVDKLTEQDLSKELHKLDMGSIIGAEKIL